MDQQVVTRPERLFAQGVETSGAGGHVVGGRGGTEVPRRELQPEERRIELRGGAAEGGGNLLHDLLLQRGVGLLDGEPLAQSVEVRALVPAVLELAHESLPRRAAHRLSDITVRAPRRVRPLHPWYRPACAHRPLCRKGRACGPALGCSWWRRSSRRQR